MATYPHGTGNCYRMNGCRCAPCRAAQAKHSRDRRRAIAYGRWEGLLDSTGTIRRLRALAATGWSFVYIAERRGLANGSVDAVSRIAGGRYPKVRADIARAYALLYDELCTSDGPSKRARTWAAKRGWYGPEAWTDDTIDDPNAQPMVVEIVDEVAVQRAVNGEAGAAERLNHAERLQAARRLLARGGTTTTVAKRLRMSGNTAAKLVGTVQREAA